MEEVIRLLHSLYPWDYIKRLSPRRIIDFTLHAKERENKKEAWDMWIAKYSIMKKENFISFKDFYRKLTTPVKTIKAGGLPPKKLYENMKNKVKKAS